MLLLVACRGSALGQATAARAERAPCQADADCAARFCDRGRCRLPEPPSTLGDACEPGVEDSKAEVGCQGLLCLERRCRSCVESAECGAGSRCHEGRCIGVVPEPTVAPRPEPPPMQDRPAP